MSQAEADRLVLEALPGLGLTAGASVLLLAGPGSGLEPLLLARHLIPACPDPSHPLPRAEQLCAAAIVAGGIESVEWDRWVLQQVRERLEPGSPLVLVVPNLASLASVGDAWWLAGRILRGVFAKLRRKPGAGSSVDSAPFRGRRYTAARIRTVMGQAGFELVSLEPRTAGLLSPALAVGLRQAARFSRHWAVRGRSRPPDPLGGWVPLAPGNEHVTTFEHDQARFVKDRDAWAARHPEAVAGEVREFDPRAHAGSCALVFAPHPDDEIIGCGGTLLRLIDAGAHVVSVQATDGSDSAALRHVPEEVRRTVRIEEARAVAEAAGIQETVFWRADNRAFRVTDALVGRAADLLTRHRPRLIFTPFLADIHPDHLTLNRILARAIERAGAALEESLVLGYEVWSLAPPGLVCDVTDVRARQEKLLWHYATAMKVDDFIELCERRNRYHAVRLLGRAAYAEVFHATPARAYPALVDAAGA
jgi:LmbE family N-acetylglucosaminyl deacetylase